MKCPACGDDMVYKSGVHRWDCPSCPTKMGAITVPDAPPKTPLTVSMVNPIDGTVITSKEYYARYDEIQEYQAQKIKELQDSFEGQDFS